MSRHMIGPDYMGHLLILVRVLQSLVVSKVLGQQNFLPAESNPN